MCEYIHLMEGLYDKSVEYGLRFIVLKGLACAEIIYGNLYSRESNDLDILVENNDPSKADWIIVNHLGFKRHCQRSQSGDEDDYPYLTRRNDTAAHVLPYIKHTSCGTMRIELHDRIEGIDDMYTRSFVWNTSKALIDGRFYNTLDCSHIVISMLVSAFHNSESFFSNQKNGWILVRDYLDLRFYLLQQSRINWKEINRLIHHFGISQECSIASNNLLRLFPADARLKERISCLHLSKSASSIWPSPIEERAFDNRIRLSCFQRGVSDYHHATNRRTSTLCGAI